MSTPIINVTQTQPPIIQPRLPIGPQGPKGDPAPEVKIQYSTDNSTWHDTFQAGDKYMRISTDGGSTWTQGYKFIGDDGQDAPNVLIQFSPDNSNWHTDYQQGDAYVRFSNDNGVTWTNGVPVAVNADTLDGYHASDFQAMIDQKVDEFILPRKDSSAVTWHKVGELTTDIGAGANNLTLLVSGVSDYGRNKPGVDLVQISTRGGVSVDVYSLATPGARSQTYGYVNNTSTEKTEIWVKRSTFPYETHFAVLNVYDDFGGATYGNLASSSTEPSGIVYVDIKTHWTSGNDGSGSGLDADLLDGYHASQTPLANTIPVADAAGTISPKWIDVYSLIPYWKVSIDETSAERTTPTNFTVSRVVKYMSYGPIFWYISSWGTWSSLWEMKVKSPTAISITGKIGTVDDNVYIYLNNNLVVSTTSAGFKNKSFTLNLDSGDNLIQIVHNNTGGATCLDIEIDFDWRTLEFVPIQKGG